MDLEFQIKLMQNQEMELEQNYGQIQILQIINLKLKNKFVILKNGQKIQLKHLKLVKLNLKCNHIKKNDYWSFVLI